MKSRVFVSKLENFFRFFCLLPPIIVSHRKILTLPYISYYSWVTINFGLIALEVFGYYANRADIFQLDPPTGQFISAIRIFPPIINHVIMIVEPIIKAATIAEILKVITEIDDATEPLGTQHNYEFVQRFVIKLIFMYLMCLGSEVGFISSVYTHRPKFATAWCMRLWSVNVVRVGMLELILYTEWLTNQVNILRMELEKIKTGERKKERIGEMQLLHAKLWRFTKLCNDRFSWTLLMAMANFFICLSLSMFLALDSIYFKRHDLILRKRIVCSVNISKTKKF